MCRERKWSVFSSEKSDSTGIIGLKFRLHLGVLCLFIRF